MRATRADLSPQAVGKGLARDGGVHAAQPVYEPRWTEPSVLQEVLRQQLPGFIAEVERGERSVPTFVQRELESIANCGDPKRGVTRWRCDHCGHDRILPWRCKSSLCSSCAGRRMAEKTLYLVDQIMPHVPVRQIVITFPHPLRYLLAYDAELCGAVARIAVHCIFSWMNSRAKDCLDLRSVSEAHCGAVTAIQ